MDKKRILFSGYAPVHFLCFYSVYQYLSKDPRVELWLSGGFRKKNDDKVSYLLDGFYDSFDVDHNKVIPIEKAREEDFDVLVCSHLSDSLFPKSAHKTVQIFHGVSFKNFAVREKALRFDLLCLPGNYHASRYRKRGLIRKDGANCLLTGFPKMDAFFDGSLDEEDILRKANVNPDKPTILYAPTGGKHNSLETMGEEVIEKLSMETSWNLLIKPHDHPKNKINWFSRLARFENERVQLLRDTNVIPYLYAADLLISDASSVTVEYTLMDRPIVFLDVPKLFEKVIKRGGDLDLDTYGRKIGTTVYDPNDIVQVVRNSFSHPREHSELRQKMAKDVFFTPGGATERVANVILYAAEINKSLGNTKILSSNETERNSVCKL
ncbi:CDP-glycerol glycerophosphotransferase family protein [Candidatus Uabimicrobium sp. HlEnr_7]|uniref:CDP-glycerol glycerophosphotransferase family protein n=1 Tax=Candidatus Uabimicrobium helgolandensis TaxID=3095367 RepID=UPI003556A4AF